ncbi:MAG: VOC family protein [Pseudomonadota bacterium]
MIDHLVFAGPSLDDAVEAITAALGERPLPGGRHPGFGTANALLRLGRRCYLEVIGPDPEHPGFEGERPFGINELAEPRIVAWASERGDLPALVDSARAQGVEIGDALPMSRETTDGQVLRWTLTLPQISTPGQPELRPFFIDWGATTHPAEGLPGSLSLEGLRVTHPEPGVIQRDLDLLGITMTVTSGLSSVLGAVIKTPGGRCTLS